MPWLEMQEIIVRRELVGWGTGEMRVIFFAPFSSGTFFVVVVVASHIGRFYASMVNRSKVQPKASRL